MCSRSYCKMISFGKKFGVTSYLKRLFGYDIETSSGQINRITAKCLKHFFSCAISIFCSMTCDYLFLFLLSLDALFVFPSLFLLSVWLSVLLSSFSKGSSSYMLFLSLLSPSFCHSLCKNPRPRTAIKTTTPEIRKENHRSTWP